MLLSTRFLRLALIGLALTAPPASATTVVPLDTRGLVRSSSDIVVGKVLATRSYWNPERTRIFTDVTVEVGESLKGAGGTLTLTQLGGEVDGARYSVPGSPSFQAGEEALVFAWRDSRGAAQVNGLAQGKFEIQRDGASGARMVRRSMSGLGFRDVRSLALLKDGERAPSHRLDDLLREVRRVLAEDGR